MPESADNSLLLDRVNFGENVNTFDFFGELLVGEGVNFFAGQEPLVIQSNNRSDVLGCQPVVPCHHSQGNSQ